MVCAALLPPAGALLVAAVNLLVMSVWGQIGVLEASLVLVLPVLVSAAGAARQRLLAEAASSTPGLPARVLAMAFEGANDGMVLVDGEASVVEVNGALCRMLGYTHDELLALNAADWQAPDSLERIQRALRDDGAAHSVSRYETTYRRKDGSRFPVEVSARVFDVDGARFVVDVVRDISDHLAGAQARELQDAALADLIDTQTRDLVRARDRAVAADRAKDCFLANVSHEMRTPLHAVQAFASLGLRLPPGEEPRMRSYLERIRSSAEDLSRFVDDLVILSSLHSGDMECEIGQTDFGALLARVGAETSAVRASKALQLDTDVQVRGSIHVDARLAARLVDAMISHACLRAPEGSVVRLSAHYQTGLCDDGAECPGFRLRVEDAGTPMTDEALASCFDAFFDQIQTDTAGASTGLLLAISRQIVRLHAGTIALRNSDPAPGVALDVWLPLLTGGREAAAAPGDAV